MVKRIIAAALSIILIIIAMPAIAANQDSKVLESAAINTEYDEKLIEIENGDIKKFNLSGNLPAGLEIYSEIINDTTAVFGIKGSPTSKGVYVFSIEYFLLDGTSFKNISYCLKVKSGYLIYEDFEDALTGWTTIDADNDGHNWLQHYSDYSTYEGKGVIASESFSNQFGELTPDNWLISPEFKIDSNSILSWYDKGQDTSFSEETYSVYVGSGTDTDNYIKLRDYVSTNNWVQRQIDLSEYKSDKYVSIAFRHYTQKSNYALNIDLITVTEGEIACSEIILNPAIIGSEYSHQIAKVDGCETINAVNLPDGFKINKLSDGVFELSGTPVTCGTNIFKLSFYDKDSNCIYESIYTLPVVNESIDLINSIAAENYSQIIKSDANISDFNLIWGDLPQGFELSLDEDGNMQISGITHISGIYRFIIDYVMTDGSLITCAYKLTVENNTSLGDVNEDGKVNTADAVTLLKYASGVITLSDSQLIAGDCNKDSKVNTADAVSVLRYAAGIITEF